MHWTKLATLGGIAAAIATGCGGGRQQAAQQPQGFAGNYRTEMEQERQEFINESQTRLDELSEEIARLKTRLQREARHVDEDTRAEWSHDLFELEQEKNRLQAQLQFAQQASFEEWEEMRSNFGMALDGLQAGVATVQQQVMQAFGAGGGEAPPATQAQATVPAHVGLCRIDVPGAEADMREVNNQIVLTVTTSDPQQVEQLRRRAQQMASDVDRYTPAVGAGTEGERQPIAGEEPIDVQVRTQNIDSGVILIVTPSDPNRFDALRSHIESDMRTLGSGRCEMGTGSMP